MASVTDALHDHGDASRLEIALLVVADMGPAARELREEVIAALDHENERVQLAAVIALTTMPVDAPSTIGEFIARWSRASTTVRGSMVYRMKYFPGQADVCSPLLYLGLGDPESGIRYGAVATVARIGGHDEALADRILSDMSTMPEHWLPVAIAAVGATGTEDQTASVLLAALQHNDAAVRDACARVLIERADDLDTDTLRLWQREIARWPSEELYDVCMRRIGEVLPEGSVDGGP